MNTKYSLSLKFFCILIGIVPIVDMFLPKTNFGAGIPDIDAIRLLSYMLIIVFFIELAAGKQKVEPLDKWILFILGFTIIKCISPAWSPWYSFNKQIVQSLFNTVVVPLIVVIIARNIFIYPKNIHQYLKIIFFSAAILSIIAIIQQILQLSFFAGQQRAASTMNNPNLLAIYLVACIPCLLYSIDKKIISSKIGVIVQLIIIGGVISTVSKKGIGTMVLCYLLYFILTKQYKKVIISLSFFSLVAVLISGYGVVSNRFSGEMLERQFVGKWNMTIAGVKMFLDKPILGNGYNGYYERFGEFIPSAWNDKYDAHNEFVTALANYGIPGFISFVFIFLYPLLYSKKIFRLYRQKKASIFEKDMAIIAVCVIIPFMISAFYAGALFSEVTVVFVLYTHVSFMFSAKNSSSTQHTTI